MAASPQTAPIDRIDALNAHLGMVQNQLLAIFAESNLRHQSIDTEYAPRINTLLKDAQDAFNELHRLCEAHRDELLPSKGAKPAKSTKRNTGTIGWRSAVRVLIHVSDEEFVARMREAGQAAYRRYVRRTVRYEPNRDSLAYTRNRDEVGRLLGVELDTSEDFYAHPSCGLRMSSAKPWWPTLEGLSSFAMLNTVTKPESDA